VFPGSLSSWEIFPLPAALFVPAFDSVTKPEQTEPGASLFELQIRFRVPQFPLPAPCSNLECRENTEPKEVYGAYRFLR